MTICYTKLYKQLILSESTLYLILACKNTTVMWNNMMNRNCTQVHLHFQFLIIIIIITHP